MGADACRVLSIVGSATLTMKKSSTGRNAPHSITTRPIGLSAGGAVVRIGSARTAGEAAIRAVMPATMRRSLPWYQERTYPGIKANRQDEGSDLLGHHRRAEQADQDDDQPDDQRSRRGAPGGTLGVPAQQA